MFFEYLIQIMQHARERWHDITKKNLRNTPNSPEQEDKMSVHVSSEKQFTLKGTSPT